MPDRVLVASLIAWLDACHPSDAQDCTAGLFRRFWPAGSRDVQAPDAAARLRWARPEVSCLMPPADLGFEGRAN